MSILFVAVTVMGDKILAQQFRAHEMSIHGQIKFSGGEKYTITPLGSAISLGHRHLVQEFIQTSSNSLEIMDTNCLEQAFERWDIEILRMLLDHTVLLISHKKRMAYGRSLQATESEKFELGALLTKKFDAQPKNRGKRAPLQNALYKTVHRKELAMANFLLEYGARDAHIIRSAAARHWLEGIRLLASQKGLITLEDIIFAYEEADDYVGNLLLSLNPSFATHVVNKVMEVSGLKGLAMVIGLGADINSPSCWESLDNRLSTYPLHFAVRQINSQMVKALLNARVDVHRKDQTG